MGVIFRDVSPSVCVRSPAPLGWWSSATAPLLVTQLPPALSPLPGSSLAASASSDKCFPGEARPRLESWVHEWQVCCKLGEDNPQNIPASLTRYAAFPAPSCSCELLERPELAVIAVDIVRSLASLPETNLSFMKKCLLGQLRPPNPLN